MAQLISASNANAGERAANVLECGGTVVFPTDTVYALAALPGCMGAISEIFELKSRPEDMHLTLLVYDQFQVASLSSDNRSGPLDLMERLWPGALTLVIPKAGGSVVHLGADDGTIGVRSPDHEFARTLARRVGPIATTSANLHGHATPLTAAEVADQLPGVDLVIDGGRSSGDVPSTVVDVTGAMPKILREGPISAGQIMEVWASSDH